MTDLRTPFGFPDLPKVERIDVRPLEDARCRLETLREEFGVTARHTIGGHLDEMRREASEARDVARKNNEGELYAWLNTKVSEIEEMQMALSEGEQDA